MFEWRSRNRKRGPGKFIADGRLTGSFGSSDKQMGLIKSTQATPSITTFSMIDVEEAAKRVILRAQRQAERLLAETRKEADAIKLLARAEGEATGRREGYAAGMDAGKKAGHEQALAEHREQLGNVLRSVTAIANELDERRCELEVAAEREVIELAIAIAERVTKRLGAMDPAVLTANVSEALKLVVHAADVRMAIHPAQKAALTDALPRLRMEWPALGHVELIEDPAIASGGCRLFTHRGSFDADLDVQLRNIAAALVPDR